jgi:hypothetical protein
MRRGLLPCLLFFSCAVYGQIDSTRIIEPNKETSYTNKDLILIALAALALLIAIYFLFKRARARRN